MFRLHIRFVRDVYFATKLTSEIMNIIIDDKDYAVTGKEKVRWVMFSDFFRCNRR